MPGRKVVEEALFRYSEIVRLHSELKEAHRSLAEWTEGMSEDEMRAYVQSRRALKEERQQDIAWVSKLADEMDRRVWDPLITAMLTHGEDPADNELWCARKAQLALALRSRAGRCSE